MAHLEDLLVEYYDWRGYVVKRNIKVGRLSHGGWSMELDVLAHHPHTGHLIHLEPSLDAHSWARREERFAKKFAAGRNYIFSDVFTWLDKSTPVDQVAMLVSHPKNRDTLAGARIQSVDEFMAELCTDIRAEGKVSKRAIPEQYPLLRTLQLALNGYYRLQQIDEATPMNTGSLGNQIDEPRLAKNRIEIEGKMEKATTLRGLVEEKWRAAGRPAWSYTDTRDACVEADRELAGLGLNPARRFREEVSLSNDKYEKQWVNGCHFEWLHPR